MNAYIGEIAAMVTSLLWSGSSIFFSIAGRKLNSTVMNRIRLILAMILLLLAHFLLRIPLPIWLSAPRLFWLGLSGFIGLSLGDTFLYQAYRHIGPRLAMLLMSLSPILAALVAWIFMHEALAPVQIAGIGLTMGGVAWVVFGRSSQQQSGQAGRRHYLMGVVWGLCASACQALGLVTAKMGTGNDLPSISATLVRMVVATVILWTIAILSRQVTETAEQCWEHKEVFPYILSGAVTGPFLGVSFSMYAIQKTEVGIASTLMALSPIFLLPISYYFLKERFGWQAIAGTLIAMLGVALLFLA